MSRDFADEIEERYALLAGIAQGRRELPCNFPDFADTSFYPVFVVFQESRRDTDGYMLTLVVHDVGRSVDHRSFIRHGSAQCHDVLQMFA